jgi:Ca-activated chloride channel homolog
MKIRIWIWLLFPCMSFSSASLAQEEDEDIAEEVAVYGIRATPGGAQDINFFRSEAAQARIPHPETFTAEGLFSEHDILFAAKEACNQLFCLVDESMPASLLVQPEAKILVGLGFTSNIPADKWRRSPLNLVAVVDKSGSMDGHPLEMVRQSLKKIVSQLKDKDQLSIVLYGDESHVYLEPIKMRGNKNKILRAIDRIESAGSTDMEEGLEVGYKTAFRSMDGFKGTTRLMLFTDERPNVGNTDAESFMGMAIAASAKGVGLTTIGVGLQFGAELATEISSVRGGNLFYIQNEQDINNLYDQELDYMVSELAHDLHLTITANPDYSIAGIYGVPGEMLGWQQDKTVSVTIPTVFFSSKGGAIFFSLAKNIQDAHLPQKPLAPDALLAKIDLRYVPATGGGKAESDSLTVEMTSGEPSKGMRLGHVLLDEFTSLHRAVSEHYLNNDQEQAYQIIHALSTRLKQSQVDGLESEKELVSALEDRFAFLSGHGSEASKNKNFVRLWDVWEVSSIEGDFDMVDEGDKLVFTPDNKLTVYEERRGEYREGNSTVYGSDNRQIYLEEWELTLQYKIKGDKLKLQDRSNGITVHLVKSSLTPKTETDEK